MTKPREGEKLCRAIAEYVSRADEIDFNRRLHRLFARLRNLARVIRNCVNTYLRPFAFHRNLLFLRNIIYIYIYFEGRSPSSNSRANYTYHTVRVGETIAGYRSAPRRRRFVTRYIATTAVYRVSLV